MRFVWIIFVSFVALLIFLIAWYVILIFPRRRRESGFEYVYVEDDGTARELDSEEVVYLTTEFQGADGNRPYIKFRYESRTPDGKMRGYLRRRQLPRNIIVKSVETSN